MPGRPQAQSAHRVPGRPGRRGREQGVGERDHAAAHGRRGGLDGRDAAAAGARRPRGRGAQGPHRRRGQDRRLHATHRRHQVQQPRGRAAAAGEWRRPQPPEPERHLGAHAGQRAGLLRVCAQLVRGQRRRGAGALGQNGAEHEPERADAALLRRQGGPPGDCQVFAGARGQPERHQPLRGLCAVDSVPAGSDEYC